MLRDALLTAALVVIGVCSPAWRDQEQYRDPKHEPTEPPATAVPTNVFVLRRPDWLAMLPVDLGKQLKGRATDKQLHGMPHVRTRGLDGAPVMV